MSCNDFRIEKLKEINKHLNPCTKDIFLNKDFLSDDFLMKFSKILKTRLDELLKELDYLKSKGDVELINEVQIRICEVKSFMTLEFLI